MALSLFRGSLRFTTARPVMFAGVRSFSNGADSKPKPKPAGKPAASTPPPPPSPTSSASSSSSSPKINVNELGSFRGIPGRYARIILETAQSHGVADSIRAELGTIFDNSQRSFEFRSRIYRTPVDQLSLSPITSILIDQLRAKKHIQHLPNVCRMYEDAMRTYHREKHLTIVTAKELPQADVAKFLSKINADLVDPNRHSKLVLNLVTDSTIMGGFILQDKESMFDLSVKSLFEKWDKAERAKIQAEHDKRVAELRAVMAPHQGPPKNTEFLAQVQKNYNHLLKISGLSELESIFVEKKYIVEE